MTAAWRIYDVTGATYFFQARPLVSFPKEKKKVAWPPELLSTATFRTSKLSVYLVRHFIFAYNLASKVIRFVSIFERKLQPLSTLQYGNWQCLADCFFSLQDKWSEISRRFVIHGWTKVSLETWIISIFGDWGHRILETSSCFDIFYVLISCFDVIFSWYIIV